MYLRAEHSVELIGDFVTNDKQEHSRLAPKAKSALAKLGRAMVGVNKSYRRLARE